MLAYFDLARDISILGVTARLAAALICGGLIGIEREFKRRPAGFRTHILICLGAAMTTLTSQYLYLRLDLPTDVARLGAQVICGVGFIGAGSIVVTGRQRVKGLTTAAGLWTTAIIGLVCGAGYIEGALAATLLVLAAELLLIKLEYRFARRNMDLTIYVEYAHAENIQEIVRAARELHVKLSGLEISRSGAADAPDHRYCAVLTIQSPGEKLGRAVIDRLTATEGVLRLETL